MASTVSDRELRGKDFVVGLSEQTAKGAINVNPVFTPYRRTDGIPLKTISYTEDSTVKNDFHGLEQIQENKDLAAEIQSTFSKQSVGLIIQALHGVEVDVALTETDIAATATGFTSAGNDFGVLSVGDGFWMDGFTNPLIDGFYIVSTVTAGEITTTIAPVATEAAGATVDVTTSRVLNADLPTWNTLQLTTHDLSRAGNTAYQTFYDAILNTLSGEIGETGIVTNSASFMAEKEVEGLLLISGQTYAASSTDRSVTSVKGADASVQSFYVDGLSARCVLKNLSFEINNNYEKDESAACDARYFRGQPTFTGSFTARTFISDSRKWVDKKDNSTRCEIGVRVSHGGGDESYLVFRQCVITEVTQANANNSVANSECSFVAEKDSAANVTVALYKNW